MHGSNLLTPSMHIISETLYPLFIVSDSVPFYCRVELVLLEPAQCTKWIIYEQPRFIPAVLGGECCF